MCSRVRIEAFAHHLSIRIVNGFYIRLSSSNDVRHLFLRFMCSLTTLFFTRGLFDRDNKYDLKQQTFFRLWPFATRCGRGLEGKWFDCTVLPEDLIEKLFRKSFKQITQFLYGFWESVSEKLVANQKCRSFLTQNPTPFCWETHIQSCGNCLNWKCLYRRTANRNKQWTRSQFSLGHGVFLFRFFDRMYSFHSVAIYFALFIISRT